MCWAGTTGPSSPTDRRRLGRPTPWRWSSRSRCLNPELSELISVSNNTSEVLLQALIQFSWSSSQSFSVKNVFVLLCSGQTARPPADGHHPSHRPRHLWPHLLHGREPGVPHQGGENLRAFHPTVTTLRQFWFFTLVT